jgi:predicted solute-binding protein
MDPAVIEKHIALYVNDYTLALDERAVQVLLDWSQNQQIARIRASTLPVFA